MIPLWVVDDLSLTLDPPAHVRVLADQRSAENTLAITRALFGLVVTQPNGQRIDNSIVPKRYRPNATQTFCNIFVSDAAQLHGAPLPHRWRITPGGDLQWMSANDMVKALRLDLYPGWSRIVPARLGTLDVVERAALGLPTVATWFNPARRADGSNASGHIVWVVATPPGRTGIYVTGAGRTCVDQCPIAQAFGSHVNEVEFWGHE